MRSNTSTEFVGLENLIKRQNLQIMQFEEWAKNREWSSFHAAHYDWWMFPIDQPSRLGFAYTVFEAEIVNLKKDNNFIRNYIRGVELLLLSWGWDLYNVCEIVDPDPDQYWQQWPIRLYKCAQSLKLFDFEKELRSVMSYGKLLIDRGEDFSFRGKDLSTLFMDPS